MLTELQKYILKSLRILFLQIGISFIRNVSRTRQTVLLKRRWLSLCNKELSDLITELLGSDKWITNLDELKKLSGYAEDEEVINRFMNIKRIIKKLLQTIFKKNEGITIDPHSIFDIQIKRLHEYKRQLLNAFSILYIYFGIKSGEIINMNPVTFILVQNPLRATEEQRASLNLLMKLQSLWIMMKK